jgi:UPF0271 protein
MNSIDLNSDLGEGCDSDDAMLAIVTSANIACGGHAGDDETMRRTLSAAIERGVVVGAHPSYPDREGFGRRRIACAPADIRRFVREQVETLMRHAAALGTTVRYVKPHGALGNDGAADRTIAEAVLDGMADIVADLAVLAISGTELERAARERGLPAFPEVYADRAYTNEGFLVPRTQPGAVIEDIGAAVSRLGDYVATGNMATHAGASIRLAGVSICVHGDNPHAVDMAAQVKRMLERRGVAIRPFL